MKRANLRTARRRGRLAGCAILVACAVSANSNALALTDDVSPSNHTETVDFTAAQAAAREHLDRFFGSVLDEHGVGQMEAAVRIAVPRQDGGHEMIWVAPFQAENGQYIGFPHNAPAQGSIVQFDRAQVVDWSFAGPDGRLYGNYATRFFLQTLSAEQARNMAAILSDTAAPEEWLQ